MLYKEIPISNTSLQENSNLDIENEENSLEMKIQNMNNEERIKLQNIAEEQDEILSIPRYLPQNNIGAPSYVNDADLHLPYSVNSDRQEGPLILKEEIGDRVIVENPNLLNDHNISHNNTDQFVMCREKLEEISINSHYTHTINEINTQQILNIQILPDNKKEKKSKIKIEELLNNYKMTQKDTKYDKIINYLDKCHNDVAKSEIKFTENQIISNDFNKYHNLNNQKLFDIKGKFTNVNHEVVKYQDKIRDLEQNLDKEKDHHKKLLQKIKYEHEQELKKQKLEFENTIERNINFLDNLVNDKKELTDKCELNKKRMKQLELKNEKRIKDLISKHEVEIKKSKEASAASEKIRREKWMQEKSHEIKEVTVRGLEPEIQRILLEKKKELRIQDDNHQEILQKCKENIVSEYETKIKSLREKLEIALEEQITNEKRKSEVKLDEQYKRLEGQFEDQKKRWRDSILEECGRVELLRKKDLENYELQGNLVAQRNEGKLDNIHKLYINKIKGIEDKHSIQMLEVREIMKNEYEEWREKYINTQNKEINNKIKDIREGMLDKYGNLDIESLMKTGEINLKEEISNLENNLSKYTEKYNELKYKNSELTENIYSLKSELSEQENKNFIQKHTIINLENSIQTLNSRLLNMNTEQMVSQREIEEVNLKNIENLEIEIRRLGEENVQLKLGLESYSEEVKRRYKGKMEGLEGRVTQALENKERIIKALEEENVRRMGQIDRYKELLGGK